MIGINSDAAMSFETIQKLSLADSMNLPFRQSLADTDKAVVQICHGLAEHSARYARFAQALNRAGFHVYASDHRGHGANIGVHAPKGVFALRNGHALVISDVLALNRHIRHSHPGLPVILFGHSMGGLIALNYVQAHGETIDGAAIWNANLGRPAANNAALALLYAERMLKGSDVPSTILPRLTFRAWGNAIAGNRTPFDWLSHEACEVDAYIADPLCGFDPSVALWINIFHLMKNATSDSAFAPIRRDLPFNLVGGAEDPATNNGAAVRKLENKMRQMGFGNLHCTIYARMRHESLNETDQQEVTQNFLNWLDEVLPSSPISG